MEEDVRTSWTGKTDSLQSGQRVISSSSFSSLHLSVCICLSVCTSWLFKPCVGRQELPNMEAQKGQKSLFWLDWETLKWKRIKRKERSLGRNWMAKADKLRFTLDFLAGLRTAMRDRENGWEENESVRNLCYFNKRKRVGSDAGDLKTLNSSCLLKSRTFFIIIIIVIFLFLIHSPPFFWCFYSVCFYSWLPSSCIVINHHCHYCPRHSSQQTDAALFQSVCVSARPILFLIYHIADLSWYIHPYST